KRDQQRQHPRSQDEAQDEALALEKHDRQIQQRNFRFAPYRVSRSGFDLFDLVFRANHYFGFSAALKIMTLLQEARPSGFRISHRKNMLNPKSACRRA